MSGSLKGRYAEYRDLIIKASDRNHKWHIDNGYCRLCFDPPRPTSQLCERHHQQLVDTSRAWRAANRAKGLCAKCTAKAEPNRSMCRRHLDETKARSKVYAERKRAKAAAAAAAQAS